MLKTVFGATTCAAILALVAPAVAADGKPYPEGGAPTVSRAAQARSSIKAFPSLTTVYVGSGVSDDGGTSDVGIATSFHCSNVSGASVQVRFRVINYDGVQKADQTLSIPYLGTRTASTHNEKTFTSDIFLNTGVVNQGVIIIQSTAAFVFCNAMITNAAVGGNGINLPLTRYNVAPGTQN